MTSLATAPRRHPATVTALPARTITRTYEPCTCGDPAGVLKNARDDTRTSCRAWGYSDRYGDDTAFAVHELVANSFIHGTPPVTVWLTAGTAGVTVRVHDKGTFIPAQAVTGEEYRHGFGIIKSLACGDLSINRDSTGTTVTFTIPGTPNGNGPDPVAAMAA
jgi:anti-sigma regulatory factor (Ser/Thr protein kinase)